MAHRWQPRLEMQASPSRPDVVLVVLLSLVLSVLLAAAVGTGEVWADDDPPPRIAGRVTDVLGRPIAAARVHVVAAGSTQTLATDKDGHYAAVLPGAGSYSVVVAHRDTRAARRATVEPGATATVDVELETSAEGEVIELSGFPPPVVLPKPQFDPQRAPPYSTQAVLSDAWTKAWLLLDVDEQGRVQRLKFLKAPGLQLEELATKHAFGMTFTPARDGDGKAVPTYIVWGMEWPSRGWLLERTMSVNRIPPLKPRFPGEAALRSVPCYGSGPIIWDSVYRTYRDCSKPDLAKATTAPWVERK